MKKAALVLVLAGLAMAGCSNNDDTAEQTKPKAEAVKVAPSVAKPAMPAGSPPPAPELKFDKDGKPILPPIVAPAPPKPAGGPQAPGLSPEAMKKAKEALAKQKAAQKAAGAPAAAAPVAAK